MRLSLQSQLKLNNGVEIPLLGLGVYQAPPGEATYNAVTYALKIGYRHIDTAHIYGNEKDVGKAVLKSGLPRKNVFITSKLWNSDQGYDSTLRACEKTLNRLGFSYLDLYLIHWPVPAKSKSTWKAMIQLLKEGKARAVGVSNYNVSHLQELMQNFDVTPSVNQIEFHPFLFQNEMLEFCKRKNIQLEAYSPLTRGNKLNHPSIINMAKKYAKTPAQILIRWSLQHDLVVIPKSIHENRIKENSDVFDFQIETSDMNYLNSLNEDLRTVFL